MICTAGKHVVVLGRSNIVGLPAAIVALHSNATVTVCHSGTVRVTPGTPHQHSSRGCFV